MRKIILASQSPQRKLLMLALGIDFEAIPADIDEQAIIDEDQGERARKIAQAKAEEVLKENHDAIIFAADTYTVVDGKAYEKPVDKADAMRMLKEQSGKTGHCYSGFTYIDKENSIEASTVAITEIVFRKLLDVEIEKYVEENPVTTWSAAFSPAYPAGINLVESCNGSLSSLTHGLPMEMLMPLLEKSGVFDVEV